MKNEDLKVRGRYWICHPCAEAKGWLSPDGAVSGIMGICGWCDGKNQIHNSLIPTIDYGQNGKKPLLCDRMLNLINLPYPISDNRKYLNGRFVKSPEWRTFETAMADYALQHREKMREARMLFKTPHPLAIKFFMSEAWFTKKNQIRRVDVANLLKSACDQIALLLEIDDSRFFSVYCEKTPLTGLKGMIAEVSLFSPSKA